MTVASAGQASIVLVGGLVAVVLGALVLGARRPRGWARGAGAAGRRPRRARRRAGDARRVLAAVRAGVRRPRAAGRGAPRQGASTSRSAGRRRARVGAGQRRRAACAWRSPTARSFAPVRVRVDRPRRVRGPHRRRPPHGADRRPPPRPSSRRRASSPARGRRLRRPARDPPGRADAAGRRARLRPHGARRPRATGSALIITSAFRSDAEQAVLFARHPDPRWVAPPGRSLHRLGTELDLGPPARLRLARAQRAALPLHPALRWEAVALRLHAQRALLAAAATPTGRRREHAAALRPGRVRAGARARRAALERLRHPARRPALRGVELQPVRDQPRRRAGHRAVHARHRRRDRPRATRSTPSRRSTPRRA